MNKTEKMYIKHNGTNYNTINFNYHINTIVKYKNAPR